MEPTVKLSVSAVVAAFEAHLEHDFYAWEIFSVSDIVLVDGFTVATIVYTSRKDRAAQTARWSYRYNEFDTRVIAYYHDQSDLAQAATIPGS